MNLLQTLLDQFYYSRRHLVAGLTFLTLRAFGKEVTYGMVQSGTYDSRTAEPLCLDDAKDVGALLRITESGLTGAEKRRAIVVEKCKMLLTLGSLLLGAASYSLPKTFTSESVLSATLSVLVMLLLFNVILILLVIFDVETGMSVVLTQSEVSLDVINLKKSEINGLRACIAKAENQTDYFVDLYLSARFCLLTALAILTSLVFVNASSSLSTNSTESIVRALRSNPQLIDLLRGPKGEPGPRGEKGDQTSWPSENELVNRVIMDSRLSDKIQSLFYAQKAK